MIVLDENIPDTQRRLLQGWRIRVHQVGHEIGKQGTKDESIIPLLHRQKNVTFFTRDFDFYERTNRHADFCIVCLDVGQYEAASFIRRFLKHPFFDTHRRRFGAVVRVSHTAIRFWKSGSETEEKTFWRP